MTTYLEPRHRVEPGGGLVEQYDGRPPHQGARDAESTAHAPAQVPCQCVPLAQQAHGGERAGDVCVFATTPTVTTTSIISTTTRTATTTVTATTEVQLEGVVEP